MCIKALREAPEAAAEGTAQGRRRGGWIPAWCSRPTRREAKSGSREQGCTQRNVVRVLHAILDGAEPKLRRIRLAISDYSAASLLIASGVELAEVSMLLGHSELRVTMDFYAHLQQQTAAKAARHMDAILG